MAKPHWKRAPIVILSPAQKDRQSRVVAAAYAALASPEAVREFLNSHDSELSARPLDLAVLSADGASRVEALLARRAGHAAKDHSGCVIG